MDNGNHNKTTLSWFVVLKVAIVLVLVTPVGLLAGILIGLISDFGPRCLVENIQLNPSMFANQYAPLIVFAGWAAIVDLVVMAAVAGVILIRRSGRV
jgi:hypothetical protein